MRIVSSLVIVCASATARAERVVQVQVPDDSPVTAAELAAALRVRIAERGAPVDVRIVVSVAGVIAEINDHSREVALDGRTGADAARLIALAVADLALDDLAVEPRLDPVIATELHVAVLADASDWTNALAGARIDVAVAHGAWVIAGELGRDGEVSSSVVKMDTVTARVEGGVRKGIAELCVGPTFAVASVSTGRGDHAALAGLGASARVRVPVATAVSLVGAVGVDAFANRTVYTDGDLTSASVSTPWLAPWAAAGAEVRW